jgi:hypothetical protein
VVKKYKVDRQEIGGIFCQYWCCTAVVGKITSGTAITPNGRSKVFASGIATVRASGVA